MYILRSLYQTNKTPRKTTRILNNNLTFKNVVINLKQIIILEFKALVL